MITRMRVHIFLFCLLIILFSCKGNNSLNYENIKDFEKFPQEVTVNFTNFLKLEGIFIRQLFLNDSSIILLDLNARLNNFFYQYSLSDYRLIRKFIKKGTKFGEALGGFTSGICNNETIWFHDLSLSRLITVKIPSNENKQDSTIVRQFKLPHFYYSVQMKDTNVIYTSGASHQKSKIQELNLHTLKEKNLFGEFNNCPNKTPYFAWKTANDGFLYIKPTNDKLILAYRFTDKIEIFDLVYNRNLIIFGPSQFEPIFTSSNRQGRDEVFTNEKTKWAFINGYVTNRYIYLLYSGRFNVGSNLDQSNNLHVYDWKGNPIKKIHFPQKISAFTISSNDSVIYAFNPNNNYLLRGVLK